MSTVAPTAAGWAFQVQPALNAEAIREAWIVSAAPVPQLPCPLVNNRRFAADTVLPASVVSTAAGASTNERNTADPSLPMCNRMSEGYAVDGVVFFTNMSCDAVHDTVGSTVTGNTVPGSAKNATSGRNARCRTTDAPFAPAELKLLVVEQGAALGGNHTWSFHDTDLSPAQHAWLTPTSRIAGRGRRCAFAGHTRVLDTGYRSIPSDRFAAVLARKLGPRAAHSALPSST